MKHEYMMPTNGGQGTSKAPYGATSKAGGKLKEGKDLRQTPSGGNQANYNKQSKAMRY
jgi:hypothetical protein